MSRSRSGSRDKSRGLVLPNAVCRLLLLLLIAHCALPTASASTWQRQQTSSLAWLHAVFFVDRDHGWAVGSRGTLLATTDGGKNWKAQVRPTNDVIRDIHFDDQLNGLIVCERNIYELKSNDEMRSYLMKTTDGGETWKRVALRAADSLITRAVFGGDGRGWAFGEGGSIFTTHDSGDTWIRAQVPTRYLLLGGTFIDASNGWLVGAGSTILQTSDGGETWNQGRLQQAAKVRFNSASFVNARQGWAVGGSGAIYRTVNGGISWQAQSSGIASDLFDVKFVDASEGWAVGADGVVLHTTNGGLRWIVERSGTTHALERIFFTDRTHGWAVGFGGTIIAYGAGSNRADIPRLRR